MSICHKCGISHSGLGLCPSCSAERMLERAEEQENFIKERDVGFHFAEKKILLAFYAAIPFLILYAVWNRIFPPPLVFASNNDYYVITSQDKRTVINFSYEESAVISGYALDHVKQNGTIQEGGVSAQLHYLDEKSYLTFKEKYGNSKRCPASFYNSHVKHVFALAGSERCKRIMDSHNFSDWGHFSYGGRYASWTQGIGPSGKIFFPGGDYRFFIVENCDNLPKL